MTTDLIAGSVLEARNLADLLQQRHIDQGLAVTGDPGVTVPVPGATEIATRFDNPEVSDSGPAQLDRREQSGDPATDDHDVHQVGARVPDDRCVRVRVSGEVGERSIDRHVLPVPVRVQALVAFLAILLFQSPTEVW